MSDLNSGPLMSGDGSPDRRSGRRVAVVLVAVLALMGIGAFLLLRPDRPDPVTVSPSVSAGTPSTAPSAPPPTSTTSVFEGQLATLLLVMPGTGTKTVGPGGADGTMDLDATVAAYDDPDAARTQLKAAGFRQGAISEWLEADGTWVGVILYQLGSPAKAKDYAQGMQNGYRSNDLFGSGVAISGVPDGRVFTRTSISSNGRWFNEAIFSKNDIAVEIYHTGPVQQGTQRTMDYAAAQYALLP